MARERGRRKIIRPCGRPVEVAGLWERLLAGEIDAVASDHAPWPLADKTHDRPSSTTTPALLASRPWCRCSPGGLLSQASPSRLSSAWSPAPARIFGLDHRKGPSSWAWTPTSLAFTLRRLQPRRAKSALERPLEPVPRDEASRAGRAHRLAGRGRLRGPAGRPGRARGGGGGGGGGGRVVGRERAWPRWLSRRRPPR